MIRYFKLSAILLFTALSASVPATLSAQEVKAAAPLRDMLLSNVGKRVALRLGGDQDIEGTVSSVGADTVLITKLAGKDFYDSLIVINKISAVTYKAR